MSRVGSDISDGEAGVWICFFIIIAFNFIAYFINERSVFHRCCKCNRGSFLGITNRAASVSRKKRPESFFAWELLDAKHLASGRASATLVLLFRIFCLSVFAFTTLWQQYGAKKLSTELESDYMEFFTNWTFVGFALVNLLGVAVSARAVLKGKKQEYTFSTVPAARPYDLLDKAFHFVYMGVVPASAALSIFYWLVVYDGKQVTVDNPIKHGVSFGLLALDMFLCRMPIVTYHVVVPIWYASAYAIFLWINYNQSGDWVYTALDWTKTGNTAYYFAMVLLLFLMFAFLYALAGLREFVLTGKCCCMCGCCGGCGDCCEPVDEAEGLEGGYAGYTGGDVYKAPNKQQFSLS